MERASSVRARAVSINQVSLIGALPVPVDHTITVVKPGSTLTASGVISGVGRNRKEGLGTLVLSGANSYTGVTRVAEDTVSVRSNTALGSTAGAGNDVLLGGTGNDE